MRIFVYILILLLPAFLISQSSIEIGFGHQKPQGYFDKYNDPGFSFRGTYSKIDIDITICESGKYNKGELLEHIRSSYKTNK